MGNKSAVDFTALSVYQRKEKLSTMKVPEPRKLKSGSYFIQLRLNGVSVPVTAPTAKECKRQAELIKAEYRANKRVIQAQEENITLRDAISKYIAERSNSLSPSTLNGYECIKKTRFKSVMGKPINSITNWQKLCNAEATLCSPKTLRNAWGLILSVLKENGIEGISVRLPQAVKAERPFLEPEQIKTFIEAMKGNTCEIAALLALHSLRKSEILALDWKDIDLEKKQIHVAGAIVLGVGNKFVEKPTNKTQKSRRYVPIMIPQLFDALCAVEDKTGKVVKCKPPTIYDNVNRICAKNGLPLVGVHGLRHSFASLAYHIGMPEQLAMELGGWSDYGTMRKIYTHLANADRAKYTNAMSDFFS